MDALVYFVKVSKKCHDISRKSLYEDVNRKTIEILQRTPIFKANHWLKGHNVPFKLASSISG